MAGKGSGAGFDYEEEMSGLVALRLCNESNIQDFKLTMNHSEVEAVDDIIFSYNTLGEKPVTVYVQLKQFDSKVKKIRKMEFEKENGRFSLLKYFDAFKNIKCKQPIWDDIDKNNEIFVLYTTAKIDPNELKSVEMFEKDNVPKTAVTLKPQNDVPLYRKLLLTGNKGKTFKFSIASEECEMEKKDFFDSLLLFVEQSSVDCLKHMIRECIQTLLGDRGDDIKLENTALKYIKYIKHRKNSTKNEPFTREEIISQVLWFYTEFLHIASKSLFTLPNQDVKAWNELISNKQIILISEYKAEYVNILQFCIDNNINKNKYLCLDLMSLHLDDQNVLKYLPETWSRDRINPYQILLLISEQELNTQQKQFLKNLVNTLESNHIRKVIIVCKNIGDIVSNISVKVEKLCNLNDLNSKNFLMQKPISYYGNSTTLGDFVEKYPGIENCFKTHHLLDLFSSDLNVGTAPCYDLDFYIERKATVFALKPTILKFNKMKNVIVCICKDSDKSDLHYKSCVQADSVTDESSLKNCNFITIPYDGSSLKHLAVFSSLKKKLPRLELILVLVGNEDSTVVWRIVAASDAVKELLKEFIYERDVIVRGRGDVTILTGEPGMGKSTFCQHLWRKNVRTWIPTFIITHTDLENVCSLKELLEYSFKKARDLTRDIFDYHCSKKNVLFILDAFDELGQTARTNALQVIKDCVGDNYSIVITTRPFTASILEQETKIYSQRLSAFDKRQQIRFLKEYWKKTMKLPKYCDKINEFASWLLEVVNDSVNDKERLITGVPLQCRMLGEIFEQQCRIYIESSELLDSLLPKKLNVVDMYKQCVEKKLEIFCSDKMKLTEKACEIIQEDIVEFYMDICQKYSLLTVFNDYEKLFAKYEKFLTKTRSDNSKLFSSGIFTTSEERVIENIKIEFPIFVHRTYAEYFAALFLSENWRSENELLNLILSSRKYDTVRYFFDLIMAKNCPLINAVIRNDEKKIENEIANIDERDECGRCALHLVAMWGVRLTDLDADGKYTIHNNEEICQLLLEHGIDVDCQDFINEWKPIRYADNMRILHIINEVLKHSSINDEDVPILINDLESDAYTKHDTCQLYDGRCRGNSLIHSVSSWGFTEVLRYLLTKVSLEHLKDDKLVNNLNQTPLHLAVNQRHIDIVRLLLTIPSIIQVADDTFWNRVLHYSAIKGFADVTELLLNNDQVRGDIDCGNLKDETALHLAAELGHADVVKLLLEAGAKTDSVDIFRYTVLHHSVERWGGNSSVVEMLLSKQPVKNYLNFVNYDGDTALNIAVLEGHIDIVKLLLMAGANPYIVNKFGYTILHYAAVRSHANIAELLLKDEQIKLNINSLTVEQYTPLDLAVKNQSFDTVKVLLDAAATMHHVDDKYGDNSLILASLNGNTDIVRLLLENEQIRNNVNRGNKLDNTALHAAAWKGHLETLKLLLNLPEILHTTNIDGYTPLHFAAYQGHFEITKLLCDYENVNSLNKFKHTALHSVALHNCDVTSVDECSHKSGLCNVAKLLLQKGVDLNATDCEGKTALQWIRNKRMTGDLSKILTNPNDWVIVEDNDIIDDSLK